jgi:hypothetical protein
MSTYEKITSVTVGSGGASSIVFNSFPSTYTDLVIKISGRTNNTNETLLVRFNADTTSTNYRRFALGGTGATAFSQNINDNGIGYINNSTFTASTFGLAEIYIPNYAGSGYKTYRTDSTAETNAATPCPMGLIGNYWNSTAAITSITLTNAGNWTEFSTATLYGITKYPETGVGSKATGGTVTTSGGFTYHTFYSSGMFTATASITGAETLVIAGGGGGGHANGNRGGGGGGAGGLVYASSQSFTSGTSYAAIVGAGGNSASLGSNSALGAGTVAIGGGRGTFPNDAGGSGGSGGGASVGSGGAATSGQGNAGGSGHSPGGSGDAGGGGGGAGAVGGNGANAAPGNGGAGSSSYSAWATATNTGALGFYAGGGGGSGTNPASFGSGGAGGGGAGSGTGLAVSGIPNTGGGGGSSLSAPGANGGSGIIIVRYTT